MNTKHHVGPASRAVMAAGSLSLFIVLALLAGCGAGAGNGNGGNNITASITNKVTSVQAGTVAVVFLATVQNDSSNSGVTWGLTANGSACSPTCGTLSLATPTTVTYTPPSSGPAAPNNQPTLSATSVAKTNKSDSDTFTITPALMVSITNKFASVNTGASAFVVNATVQNDSTNSGVTWTLTANGTACSSTTCGTLAGRTKTSVTFTPPSSVSAIQPTLTAVSVHDSSKSDSDSFTIATAPISVRIEGKVSTVYAGSPAIFLSSDVENDPSNSGVMWTLTTNGSSCNAACGTISPNQPGQFGTDYTPPTTVPTPPNITLTAVSYANGTKSDSDTFTVTAPPPISVTITKFASILATGAGGPGPGVELSAYVQNDFTNSGVTWTLTCTPPATSCGTLSPGTSTTTATYTAPASAPAQATVTATSNANGASDFNTFNIVSTVTNSCGPAGGQESLLTGHYALLLDGFWSGGSGVPSLVAASFQADGTGGITGGEEDINDTISPQNLKFTSTGSLYTVGADHRGCLQLTNTGGTTAIFRFALGGINSGIASTGRIIEFDDNSGNGKGSRGSGILRLQDPNSFVLSALQSQYSFGVDGWTPSNNQLIHFSAVGSFSGDLNNGVDDLNFGGITSVDTPIIPGQGGGSIQPISASTGRTTGNFDIFDWAIYVVNSSEFFVVGTDPVDNATVTVGRAIATGNTFTASSLSGNYVVHATGNTNGAADANLELLMMTPGGAQAGTLSGTLSSYGVGNGAQTTLSGVTYNVDPSAGRVTLGNPGDNFPILYLTTPTDGIAAFVLGVGADALFGMAEPQTSTALPAGTYLFGTEDPSDNTVANESGVETIASGGSLSSTLDQSDTTALQSGLSNSTNFSLGSDGSGTIGGNPIAITSGSKLFSIDESGGPAVIVVAEQ